MVDTQAIQEPYANEVILVTGGAGSIGRNLADALSRCGAREVIILDDLSSAYDWNIPVSDNITFMQGDILDENKLEAVFSKKPSYVFHLAAHFANQNSVEHPEKDLNVNGAGILKVLQHAQRHSIKRFVYASSGCSAYGVESERPFKESDISIKMHTPYQATKLLGELYTNYFHAMYDMPIVNARFFNVFGPGEVPGRYRNVIPNFMYWALSGKPLPITGDGTETRDWTYMGDIVNGLMAMGVCDAAIGEAINLGSGKETRVIDMATAVNTVCGNNAGIQLTERRQWDVHNRFLSSIEKAQKILSYAPQTSFHDGLEKVHQWFCANLDNIKKSTDL